MSNIYVNTENDHMIMEKLFNNDFSEFRKPICRAISRKLLKIEELDEEHKLSAEKVVLGYVVEPLSLADFRKCSIEFGVSDNLFSKKIKTVVLKVPFSGDFHLFWYKEDGKINNFNEYGYVDEGSSLLFLFCGENASSAKKIYYNVLCELNHINAKIQELNKYIQSDIINNHFKERKKRYLENEKWKEKVLEAFETLKS